ncbi:MAG: hypothetical protein JNK04_11155 [Myxococcales bacterium]|nr:hypothetical protein [Myxococcales bacterium]
MAVVLGIPLGTVLLLASPQTAFAQKAGDAKSKARDLFKAGAKAIEQGKHAEGLPLVEQAEGLFHAPTHLLWIARGKAGLGQLLEARDAYKKLIDEQLPPNASDAFKEAQAAGSTELAALDKRIPKLVVRPRPENAAGLSITMNGETLGPDRLGVPFDVAPGSFTFKARADGLEASNVTVDAVERSTTEVRLVLHPFGQKGTEDSGVTVVKKDEGWSAMKIAGVALMAGGGAGLAAGGAMGALHFVRKSDADAKYDECGADCREEVDSLDNESTLFGNLAIGLLAGGAAVLGTGIVLFAVSPSEATDEKPPVSFTVTPGFVSVEGRF